MRPHQGGAPLGRRSATRASLRAKLEESWPLLLAGGACLALGVLLALDRSTRSIDHLSPTFMFLAIGATGLLGGLASFVVGPEEAVKAQPGESSDPEREAAALRTPPPASTPASEWFGRPSPRVLAPFDVGATLPGSRSLPDWSEEEGATLAPPPYLPDPSTLERPSPWPEGRLLRLSKEGALTVYALEDALRDLELVTEVVHSRGSRLGKGNPDTSPSSSG